MLHFTIKEDGKLYVFKDLPEEPVKEPSFGNSIAADKYMQLKTRYNIAIQRAKDNAIEVGNKDEVIGMIRLSGKQFIGMQPDKDTIYSLEGCEMKLNYECGYDKAVQDCSCRIGDKCKSPFIKALITFSEKKEDKPTPEHIFTDHERNWKEDFTHENGNYLNKCIECDHYFRGHKRRVICKLCSDPTPEKKEEETQEELWNDIDHNYIQWNDQEIKLSELIKDFELKRRQ
jgi:hypothetical protein